MKSGDLAALFDLNSTPDATCLVIDAWFSSCSIGGPELRCTVLTSDGRLTNVWASVLVAFESAQRSKVVP
jgi:hypothetical protein